MSSSASCSTFLYVDYMISPRLHWYASSGHWRLEDLSMHASNLTPTPSESAPVLARTLRMCPHIRQLVQLLELQISFHENDTAAFDWLHLMPDGNVAGLIVYHCALDRDFTTFILQAPFIHSVRQGDFIQTKEHLYECLTIPHLENLSVYLSEGLEVIQPVSMLPKLKHLSLVSYEFPVSAIPLLVAVGAHLERFDLDSGEYPPVGKEIPEFVAALKNHAHQRGALTIRSEHCPSVPYADHMANVIPSLEYLHLGYKTFSSALYLDLPNACMLYICCTSLDSNFPFSERKK
ncbi:hypothetical protein OBBRIDRAFT_833141 [Obba rivulosa]|uniref:Uncharacterized protein n=1 Tax=Obba rivulosa TaxID=1052685 RepID=A0A8E2AXQ1_9APHY|nr:hypothetical protein OBBRIDRAFT_833141 [Obba rivulosa]